MKNVFWFLLFSCASLSAQTLHHYFGNLHAHTSYSDGNKDSATSGMTTPLQAFNYAKQSSHIDFYGVSEHNHYEAGMRSPVFYQRGLQDANAATVDGEFVAMYGMEWGVISNGGHMLLYGFDSLCGWDFGNREIFVPEGNYPALYQVINRKQGSFAYMAHPQSSDYSNLFTQAYNAMADNAIVGTAMRSGPAFSTNTTYSNPSTSNYASRYNDALRRGYHVGPGIDHDTHYSVFGRQTAGRLVVLAPLLNRAEIYNAMRQRRFYASDDWNAEVTFNIQNRPMGSRITAAGNPELQVSVTDPDGENVSSMVVYSGVSGSGVAPTLLTSVNNSNTLSFTHNISSGVQYYYYVYIVQSNGDKIWTAPIWYTRNDNVVMQTPQAAFNNTVYACKNNPVTLNDQSLHAPTTWWWYAPGAYPAYSSLQNPSFTFPDTGSYSVTLVVSNQAGSDTITQLLQVQPPPVVSISAIDSLCKGALATLTASGASTYMWSNGAQGSSITISPTASGTYQVTGFQNTCFDTAMVNVQVYQAFPTPVVTKVGDTLYSNAPDGNQWFYNSTLIPGATLPSYVATQSGYYQVQVRNSAGCRSEYSLPSNVSVGIEKSSQKNIPVFLLYPNPCKDLLFVSSKETHTRIKCTVHTVSGSLVHEEIIAECSPTKPARVDVSELSSGVYVVTFDEGSLHVETRIQLE
jgi:PKD repeat protein